MSRRVYRVSGSQHYDDYDDEDVQVVYANKPRPKYVYADEQQEDLYLINGKYYRKAPETSRTNYTYIDDDYEEYPEKKIIYTPRRLPPMKKTNRVNYAYVEDDLEEYPNRNFYYSPRRKAQEKLYMVEDDDYEEFDPISYKPQRMYVPAKSRNGYKSRSVDLPQRKAPQPKPFVFGPTFRKPNHRREIEEPVIRDKPILNKPVLYGGAVVHK